MYLKFSNAVTKTQVIPSLTHTHGNVDISVSSSRRLCLRLSHKSLPDQPFAHRSALTD